MIKNLGLLCFLEPTAPSAYSRTTFYLIMPKSRSIFNLTCLLGKAIVTRSLLLNDYLHDGLNECADDLLDTNTLNAERFEDLYLKQVIIKIL